jgi:hypothetical protein
MGTPGPWLSGAIRALASSLRLRRPAGLAITCRRSMRSAPPAHENHAFPCKPVAANLPKTPDDGYNLSAGAPIGSGHRPFMTAAGLRMACSGR